MKILKNIFAYLLFIFFILFMNINFIFLSFSFSDNSLLNLINKHKGYNDLKYYLQISDDQIPKIAHDLQNYISLKTNILDTKVTLEDDSIINFYNNKALFHMEEVRNIMSNMKSLNYILLILMILFFIFIKKDINYKKILLNSFKKVFVFYVAFLLILGVFTFLNFDHLFILVHKIFFDNDLWLFDPRYEYIISLLPSSLFFEILIRIIIMMFIFIIFLALCYFRYSNFYLQENQLDQEAK